ncbi:MAG: 3-deoxy-manno-octulosonate cytidylyltransferase, partial [Alphaproteobacteria bacterium]
MNPLVVIPSRLAATRLPGKPLADIHGEPMIVHVWRRAVEAAIGPVVVACAEAEIAAAIERAGGRAVLTDPDLPTGSDRVHEAVRRLDPERRHDVIVNV